MGTSSITLLSRYDNGAIPMSEIIKKEESELALPDIVSYMIPAITDLTSALNIPREVLASDDEIVHAWKNLPREISLLPPEIRGELVAKMCVAVSVGLFDGAINYIWNASILHLRDKVRTFGLPIVANILQRPFEERDLLDKQDSELLNLCLKLNLITEEGYFYLDQCRDTRNNFSAAHPPIGTLNDREIITFVNRCAIHALGDLSSPTGVDLSAFVTAIKGDRFAEGQCQVWVERLKNTHDAQRQMLIGTVHGIYCDPSIGEQSRQNALDISQEMGPYFDSGVYSDLINRHSEYLAKGDTKRHTASQQFFERLGLLHLLNETEKHTLVSNAIKSLWSVHQGLDNFYNEPPFAERLFDISLQEAIPDTTQDAFVETVVGCFIGNGYGVSRKALTFYESMIRGFTPNEIVSMIRLPSIKGIIGNRLKDRPMCNERYIEALRLIEQSSVPRTAKADYERFLRKGI